MNLKYNLPIHPTYSSLGPTHTLSLSNHTVWIHLLSKAAGAPLLISWYCCSLALGWFDY